MRNYQFAAKSPGGRRLREQDAMNPTAPSDHGMQSTDLSDVLDFFDDFDVFGDLGSDAMSDSTASPFQYQSQDLLALPLPSPPPLAAAPPSDQSSTDDLGWMDASTAGAPPHMESLLQLHVRDSLFNAFDLDLQSIANDATFGVAEEASPFNSDCESEVGSSSPSHSMLDDEVADELMAQRPKKKSTSQRQKEELAYLRGKVTELQNALEKVKVDCKRHAPSSPSNTTEPAKLSAELWERMAKRQQAAKDQAEQENARLRAKLSEQIRSAKSLERMLRKRQVKYMTPPPPGHSKS